MTAKQLYRLKLVLNIWTNNYQTACTGGAREGEGEIIPNPYTSASSALQRAINLRKVIYFAAQWDEATYI